MAACANEEKAVDFTKLNYQPNWSRKHGSGKMLQVRDAMVRMGELVPILVDPKKPPAGKNLTGKYYLGDQFFPDKAKSVAPDLARPAFGQDADDVYVMAPRQDDEDDAFDYDEDVA